MAKATNSVPANPPPAAATATEPNIAHRRPLRRSPNFPYIDLPTALERIRTLYSHEHRNPTPWNVAAGHWDYSATSSSMDKTVGALNAYGLVESAGSGDARTIRLSERALDIVEDEREESPERTRAIQEAALAPAIHKTIRDRFGSNLPSDANLRTVLVRELDFNPNAVGTVIANYRASIDHAQLDSIEEPAHTPDGDHKPNPSKERPRVGDFFQWVSQGIARFPTPLKLTGLSEDGEWAFLEGSPTGVPVRELKLAEPPDGAPASGPRGAVAMVAVNQTPPLAPAAGETKTETFALDRGEVIVRWPSRLTPDEFQDIEEWMDILKRKIKRGVQDLSSNPE